MIEHAWARYRDALERVRGVAGFAGLGIGVRETAGRPTGEAAWRVYVTRKQPLRALAARLRVPALLLGLPVDVVEAAPRRAAAVSGRPPDPPRPPLLLREGAAIVNNRGVPGSLGCVARLRRTGEPALLSSCHVLFGRRCEPGEPIWRAPAPGGGAPPAIGRVLVGKVGLVAGCDAPTFVDAAIGAADETVQAPPPARAAPAEAGGGVTKLGAATGLTRGVVVDVCYPERWYWEYRSEDAPRQLLVRPAAADGAPFSRTGDSGAVVRDDRGRVVGLLWGSNARGEGVACPIDAVARALGLRFDDTPGVHAS